MKAYQNPQKEDNRKIRQREQKLEKLEQKYQTLAQEAKYLRRRVKELSASRDNWKAKSKYRRLEIKSLERTKKQANRIKRHHYQMWLVVLCIKLRIIGGCSYRGISRIIQILRCCSLLHCSRLPCANTIENWVTKMGHYCLTEGLAGFGSAEVCLIIDESIGQGNERLIVLLVVPFTKRGNEALRYEDVQIGYMGGQTSWTSEKIKQVVRELEKNDELNIRAVLSDQDTKLLKAIRLLGLPHLPDINHAMASCLRKTFEKEDQYRCLIKQIGNYQSRSVNQDLSYLRPPKQRVKARFMNQKAFVQWALDVLDRFELLNKKEQTFFAQLPSYRPLLEILNRSISMAHNIATMFKTEGLCESTLTRAQCWIDQKTDCEELEQTFLDHLQTYLDHYERFLQKHRGTFHLSSDVIESLFGKYKHLQASNPLLGVTGLELEMPVHCLSEKQIEQRLKTALEATFTSDLQAWRQRHCSDNQAGKRREFFKKRA